MEPKRFILENTRIITPLLCPEIRLHLITEACPLWTATEKDLAALGLEDPYWGFCWAGGHALARYLLDRPEEVRGKRVLDFGTGCGITAIAAGLSGAKRIVGSDIDPLAAEAARLNGSLNGVFLETTTRDLIGEPLPEIDVLLAGDMFYDPAFARRVIAWFQGLAASGVRVLLGDPSRGNLGGVPLTRLFVTMAPTDVDLSGKYLHETAVYALEGQPAGV